MTYNLNEIVSNLSNFNGISIQGAIKLPFLTEKKKKLVQIVSELKFREVKSVWAELSFHDPDF